MLTSGPATGLREQARHPIAGRPTNEEKENRLASILLRNDKWEHQQIDNAEKIQTVAGDTLRGEKQAGAGQLKGICVPS